MPEVKTERRAAMQFAKSAYWYFLFWGICSALGTTLSTLIDAILVGNIVGSDGLAVTSIATPVFLVYALLGMTLGVGANVYIGRSLGASDVENANLTFHRVLLVGLAVGLVCLAIVLPFRERMLDFLGAEGDLRPLARQYLTVVFGSAPVFVLYHIMSASVRTDSDPKLAAASSAAVVVVHLTLDIVFMQVQAAAAGGHRAVCDQRLRGGVGLHLPGCGDVHLQYPAAGHRQRAWGDLCRHFRRYLYHEYHSRRRL